FTATPARAAQTLTVNDPADSTNAGTHACPATPTKTCTLRLAVQVANGETGDTINLPANTYNTGANGPVVINASVTIAGADPRTTIIDNGGAGRVVSIETSDLSVAISNVTIQNGNTLNLAPNQGGGIWNNTTSSLTLNNVAILNNRARGTDASQGGGIWEGRSSHLVITNSLISGNSAPHGTDPNGPSQGGGIYAVGATVDITNTTIQGNSSDFGGGIYNFQSTVNLLNDTISQNTATGVPAALAQPNYGGGLYDNLPQLYNLTNTIVANNTNGDCLSSQDSAPSFVSKGHNLDSDGTCKLTATGDKPSTNPQLAALALNAPGQTKTMAIGPGSPALDTADPALCPATDQRGAARRTDNACDIGAFEFVEVTPKLPPTGHLAPAAMNNLGLVLLGLAMVVAALMAVTAGFRVPRKS
ncbi:MAG: right-handed parallel beta-helix repeat-containing protein, partial [Candidatus Dormibacteraeota bacterium]|nr:right-handed parallel beta-helix repeat-containing protein [Candidatus Dormibacteraeota bacterium]